MGICKMLTGKDVVKDRVHGHQLPHHWPVLAGSLQGLRARVVKPHGAVHELNIGIIAHGKNGI